MRAQSVPVAKLIGHSAESVVDVDDNELGLIAGILLIPGGEGPVEIVVTKDADKVTVSPSGPNIFVGDLVTFTATGKKLKASLEFEIVQGLDLRQSLAIHTSCSKALNIDDQFGSMILREFIPED